MKIKKLTALITLITVGFFSLDTFANDEKPTIEDMAWLEGKWVEHKEEVNRTIEIRWEKVTGDSMVGTWHTYKDGMMLAYEMLTLRETEDGIVYRFDYFDKKKNFENPPSAFFVLETLDGDKALFTSKREPEWDLFLEINEEGHLYGGQSNDTTGEVYVGYKAEKVSD